MGNPYEPWPNQGIPPGQQPNVQYGVPPTEAPQYAGQGPEAPQFGGPPQYAPQQFGGPPQYGPQQFGGPQYGPPRPRITFDPTRVAAAVVVLSGLVVLIASLFSLYSLTVTPSGANLPNNDAPSGQVDVGIGFYDVVPLLPPPFIAQAIPLLAVLAALTAVPAILGSARLTSGVSAVFAGAAALLSFVLIVSNPLPSFGLTGQLATEFANEVGGESVDALVDSVVSVGPGTGLILALVFSIIGWISAGVMVFRRSTPGQPAGPPPAQFPVHDPNLPPRW